MTAFPRSPRLLKASLVLLDPATGAVRRVIALQYNPDTLSRTFQVRGLGAEAGDRLEAQRLTGPPAETITFDAEIDAADQLEFPDRHRAVVEAGILPQLAALEALVTPTTGQLQAAQRLADSGRIEILPAEAPFTLLVWSGRRILPVRVAELSITEDAFDPSLHPLRAKVSLGLRVLTVNDLGPSHPGAALYLAHVRRQEALAARSPAGTLGAAGITSIR